MHDDSSQQSSLQFRVDDGALNAGNSPMEKIPPKERFSKHAHISEVSPEILKEAISRFGLSYEECQVRLLSGGFMNANFLVEIGDKKFVFRVYSSDRVTAERERDVLQFLASLLSESAISHRAEADCEYSQARPEFCLHAISSDNGWFYSRPNQAK
jgi:hypothetical protein